MSVVEVRPFRRSDRDQLTQLVNAHVEAVLPGVTVSPNLVLGQLEREPDESIVDPWVIERRTLVAVRRDAVVAAAHLLRYGADEPVGPDYRGAAEFRWVVFGTGSEEAADAVVAAGLAVMRGWGATRRYAEPALPAPACYRVTDRWPHVAAALERAGFTPGDRTEVVLVAQVADLPRGGPCPVPGLGLTVAVGGHATQVGVTDGNRTVGLHEVQGDLTVGGTRSRLAGWADTWNLWVHPEYRRRGLGTWLVGTSAERLRLGGARSLLDYAIAAPADDVEESVLPFLTRLGYTELTRTRRGWRHQG